MNELRSFAKRRFSSGDDKEAVLGLFEKARQELRQAGRGADEDAVTDVMDFLLGWCSPHMKLTPGDKPDRTSNGATQAPGEGGRTESPSERTLGPSAPGASTP